MVNSVRIIWCSLFPQPLRPLMDIPPLLGLQLPAAVWTGGGGFPGFVAWFLAETFLSHHLDASLASLLLTFHWLPASQILDPLFWLTHLS